MYSNYRSVQILVQLLKEYDISHIVLSPGGSDIPIIHSIETDPYFSCFSVVDERSAAYYAMGMAQMLQEPVACICTSGSAVCNYLPGITEAFYQNVPVVAVTADKNPYYQGQLEIQKIEQTSIFEGVVKKSVNLPIIRSDDDEWLCNRLVNEALISMFHRGTGPVHINIPIVGNYNIYNCRELDYQRRMYIMTSSSSSSLWKKAAEKLSKSNRILVVVGQNIYFSDDDIKKLEEFFERFNCVYAVEHISNLRCRGTVNSYPVSEVEGNASLDKLLPDIVISIGNNLSAYSLKPFLRSHYKEIDNWLISESGEIRDTYKCLSVIFECSVSEFIEQILSVHTKGINEGSYYTLWKNELSKIKLGNLEFSGLYVAKRIAEVIPENSVIHTAILNSTRLLQFFSLKKGVKCFSNVGTLGIDGCLSAFMGAAAVTERLCFLIIGDLSFFYDMNAAGIRSLSSNVRIILLNNGGGSEFHFFMGKEKIPTLNDFISVEHKKTAEGWILSLGYKYYSARSKKEFDNIVGILDAESDRPIFLEIFTDMEQDAKYLIKTYQDNMSQDSKTRVKKVIRKIMGDEQVELAKDIIGKIKNKHKDKYQ